MQQAPIIGSAVIVQLNIKPQYNEHSMIQHKLYFSLKHSNRLISESKYCKGSDQSAADAVYLHKAAHIAIECLPEVHMPDMLQHPI